MAKEPSGKPAPATQGAAVAAPAAKNIERLSAENQALQVEIDRLRNEIKLMARRHADMHVEVDHFCDEIQRLQNERSRLEQQVHGERAQSTETRRAIEEAQMAAARAQQVAAQAQAELAEVRQAADAALTEAQRQIDSLRSQSAGLNQNLQAVFMSTSWRVTKPLRSVGGILKGE